ncbi:asparagine--tRNA ligase, cytoplasmic-like [Ceratina calcarata]|uniref:Asparagine--tRNA ligase, cytoplasmic-like n=1 Tax=Ceratina calcarata TaxID=156304 RepID=A0AAJ7WCC6_9HYME|nr:asparagine--tRNA ligase, cytoplasmic-like [Ceratina calcarata]
MSESLENAIYTSEKNGDDKTGKGTESEPLKTILRAMHHAGKEPFPPIYVDSQEAGQKYKLASKTQLKKIQKIWAREQHKNEDKQAKLQLDEEKRIKNLEEAKAIVLQEDTTLPSAVRIKIRDGEKYRSQRVKLFGWVHRLRRQGTATHVH